VSGFAEDLDKSKFAPHAYVMENARIKATRVHAEQKETPHLTIGADTVVVLGEQIIEKPACECAAAARWDAR
jgi:septum formation protein